MKWSRESTVLLGIAVLLLVTIVQIKETFFSSIGGFPNSNCKEDQCKLINVIVKIDRHYFGKKNLHASRSCSQAVSPKHIFLIWQTTIYEHSEFIWKKKTFIHSTSLKSQAHHLSYTLKTVMQSIPPKVQYVVCVQIQGVHISASASAVLRAVLVHIVCWKEAHLATEAVEKDTLGRTPRHVRVLSFYRQYSYLWLSADRSPGHKLPPSTIHCGLFWRESW